MFETMYDAPGVGLAATQVGIALRLAVMDCSEKKDSPIVMINPEIIGAEEPELVEEGCLSVPGHYDRIERHGRTTVRALDRHGESFELLEALYVALEHLPPCAGSRPADRVGSSDQERLREEVRFILVELENVDRP